LSRALLAVEPDLSLSVSVTTRAPRAGEVEGKHYYFIDDAAFAEMVEAGALLEHAHVFGRSYGTPRAPVEAQLGRGQDVLFDIDWQGFRQLKAALPGDVVGVFIAPPSLEAGGAWRCGQRSRTADGPCGSRNDACPGIRFHRRECGF
jgi:guanylate kinase